MSNASDPLSLRKLVRQFLAWSRKWRSPGTTREYTRHLTRFVSSVGNIAADTIKKADVLAWARTWHQLQAVQRLFNWAVHDAELMERPPFRRLKLPPLGQRKRIVDRACLSRLLRRSSPPFRAFLIAMRETLARPQEIRLLEWHHVQRMDADDGDEGTALQEGRAAFVLHDFKGKSRRREANDTRVIPITPRLGRMLCRMRRRRRGACGRIFRNHAGRKWTNNAVRLRMRWLRKKLGLKPDHRGERVVSYTLRHTLATWATAAGVRDRILADLLGHTSTRTTARYQHLQVEHLKDALASVHAKRRRRVPAPLPPPC